MITGRRPGAKSGRPPPTSPPGRRAGATGSRVAFAARPPVPGPPRGQSARPSTMPYGKVTGWMMPGRSPAACRRLRYWLFVRAGRCGGLLEQRALQMPVGAQDRRKQDPPAAADIDDGAEVGEFVAGGHRRGEHRGSLHHRGVEEGGGWGCCARNSKRGIPWAASNPGWPVLTVCSALAGARASRSTSSGSGCALCSTGQWTGRRSTLPGWPGSGPASSS